MSAKARSVEKKLPYDLDRDWLLNKMEKGMCEVTGIPFAFVPHETYDRHPFSMSLDRIDSSKGYTKDNVRVVVLIANLAKCEWYDDIVKEFASALLTHNSL